MNRMLQRSGMSGRSGLFTRIGAGLWMPIAIVVALTDVVSAELFKPLDADQYCSSVHLIDFNQMKRLDGDVDRSACHQAVATYNQRIAELNVQVERGRNERVNKSEFEQEILQIWSKSSTKLARSLLESLPGMRFDSASFVVASGEAIERNQGLGVDLIHLFESGLLPLRGTVCASATNRHPLATHLKLRSRYGSKLDWRAIRSDLLRTGFECKEPNKCTSKRGHQAFVEGRLRFIFGASISVSPAAPPTRNNTEPMCSFMMCGDAPERSRSVLKSDDDSDFCVSVFVTHL